MFYESVLLALNRNRVHYLVIGGLAVNLHGVPRTTADLDIIVDMTDDNLNRLVRALKSLGYRPTVPVRLEDFVSADNRQRWRREKGMVVFAVRRDGSDPLTVDIMLDSPIDFVKAYRRRKRVSADDVKVPVVNIDDLIRLKRLAFREQDVSDIRALRQVRAEKKRKSE